MTGITCFRLLRWSVHACLKGFFVESQDVFMVMDVYAPPV